ncbi:LysR family transcriptional regulator [Amycolatopsis sp. GM8]|uniref:LysR family transcriptional regulator n=1 Tax=Amycolatopsis sp. GM8 TaxID=2896530 RepID=UPI001F2D31B3|nr:LysR family transcriptional regulator [Amycolatopsis sp. GM8]
MPPRPLPDVTRLRLLDQVARRGSLAGAARAMGITASAVSQQISILERETGASLLDRGPRGVTLTGAGDALVERARAILSLLEETRTTMDQLGGDLAGNVRMASIASAAVSIVLPAAERLRAAHPQIKLSVTAEEPVASIEKVVDGTYDLAVIDLYDHVPVPFPDFLHVREILSEPLVLVTPKGFLARKRLGLTDLQDADWVMPSSAAACGAAVRYACRAVGFDPRVRWETDDLLLLVEAVSRRQGVTLLPRLAVADSAAPVTVRSLDNPALHRRILTICRTTTRDRPVVQAILRELERRPVGQTAR